MIADLDPPRAGRPILEVAGLSITYKSKRARSSSAVSDVSFDVQHNETVGVVGESGSGKTSVAKAVLGLVKVSAGSISFDGTEITHAGTSERRTISRTLAAVFQDPYSALSPSRTIGDSLIEPMRAHGTDQGEATARARELLQLVGLAADDVARYPASFSGGQRQRIAIARALMLQPKLVICDEPVSALDLSVQAQVLNLLKALQDQMGLSLLFIAHNLPVVRFMSHRILVMYRGRVMEYGPAATVYSSPAHPYTRALLDSAPVPVPRASQGRATPLGVVAATGQPAEHGRGCPFTPRCPFAVADCNELTPEPTALDDGRLVACIRSGELPAHDVIRVGKRPADPLDDVDTVRVIGRRLHRPQ